MRRCAGLAALLLAFCAAPAGAATVTWTPPPAEPAGTAPEDSCSRYATCPPARVHVADPGAERNDLRVEGTSSEVVVRDAATPLVAGSGCTLRPDGAVSCPAGVVTVIAGGGNDAVTALGATVDGGEGDDLLTGSTVEGGAGTDVVTGTDAVDFLSGGPGTDTVDGRGGDDAITDAEPEYVADRLDGGDGVDSLRFTGRPASVRVDLAATPQTGGSAGEGNVVSGFESAVGGEGADDLLGPALPARLLGPSAGTAPPLLLEGGAGNDRLSARSASATTLRGGAGDDELIGGGAAEIFEGDDGDDLVNGGGGNDMVTGGEGGDQLDGEDGADRLFAGPGADTASGGEGRDRVFGEAGIDTVVGGGGDDRLLGAEGTDELLGGAGRDRLIGGTAGDRLDGGLDNDYLVGGRGRDRMFGAGGNDRLRARDGARDRLVDCGTERDTAVVDRREPGTNCERMIEPRPARQPDR